MSNAFGIPEITAHELAKKRADGDDFVLLDVREQHELARASLGDWAEVTPMTQLGKEGPDALPKSISADPDREIVVMCHHGARSLQVAAWLQQLGYSNVKNLAGGIHQYAMEVDRAVGIY